MITGAVKNKVDQIWINIAAGGITNPLTVIEQLTYLMFIRSLDVKEIRNEKMGVLTGMKVPHIFPSSPVGQAMRWSHFKNKDADEIFHIVSTFVFLRRRCWSRSLRVWKICIPMIWKIRICRVTCMNICWASCRLPEETDSSGRLSISAT